MPERDYFRLAFTAPRMRAGDDRAEIMLYGEIVGDYGESYKREYPQDKSAADFDRALKQARADGAKRLLLRINSPGGVCTQAVAMRSALAAAGFEEILIRIEGLCASAATDIATLPGATVEIAEGSEYMIHNPWMFAIGSADELEREAAHLRGIEDMSRGFYAAKTGQSEETIRAWMEAETWFTAQQAVEHGFCDRLLAAEGLKAGPAAACVSRRQMAVMQAMYRAVPEAIGTREEAVSCGTPAGAPTENTPNEAKEEGPNMEIRDITREQLLAENPALCEEIAQGAVAAERQRIQEIDELTLQGYEDMAATAKADGTSAMDFMKQIVAAQRRKGEEFLAARREETAPAGEVAGGAAEDSTAAARQKAEDKQIDEYADAIAEAASAMAEAADSGMY